MSKIGLVEGIDKIAHNLRKMFDLGWGLKLDTSMSFRATLLKRSSSIVFLLALAAFQSAWGQDATSPIAFANEEAITVTMVNAPSLGGMGGGSDRNTQWLKVEFHYSTRDQVVTKDYPFVDDVQFKVWIEGLDMYAKDAVPGKGVAVALTGSVEYINIPSSRDCYGVVYVHPSTLLRYSSLSHGPEDFTRTFNVHVEASVGGKLMDQIDKNKEQDPKWFSALRPVANVVYRQDQCPFLVADPTRYPMIKPATTTP